MSEMNSQTQPRIALITGASRGLGRNMALHLAQRGVHIIGTYNSRQEDAQSLQHELEALGVRSLFLQLDGSQSGQFDAFIASVVSALPQHFGTDRIDYLVQNAGFGVHASYDSTTEEQLDQLFAIHVKAPFLLTQKLLPHLRDGGKILNISTGLTRFALPGYAAYASMKGALEVMTRYQAKELGSRGITVNTLAPGAIETDFGGGAVRDNPQVNQFVASTTALGRVGLPDDIGAAVAALLADAGPWINAQRIEVSGGQMI